MGNIVRSFLDELVPRWAARRAIRAGTTHGRAAANRDAGRRADGAEERAQAASAQARAVALARTEYVKRRSAPSVAGGLGRARSSSPALPDDYLAPGHTHPLRLAALLAGDVRSAHATRWHTSESVFVHASFGHCERCWIRKITESENGSERASDRIPRRVDQRKGAAERRPRSTLKSRPKSWRPNARPMRRGPAFRSRRSSRRSAILKT